MEDAFFLEMPDETHNFANRLSLPSVLRSPAMAAKDDLLFEDDFIMVGSDDLIVDLNAPAHEVTVRATRSPSRSPMELADPLPPSRSRSLSPTAMDGSDSDQLIDAYLDMNADEDLNDDLAPREEASPVPTPARSAPKALQHRMHVAAIIVVVLGLVRIAVEAGVSRAHGQPRVAPAHQLCIYFASSLSCHPCHASLPSAGTSLHAAAPGATGLLLPLNALTPASGGACGIARVWFAA